jgi:hypothetical protein
MGDYTADRGPNPSFQDLVGPIIGPEPGSDFCGHASGAIPGIASGCGQTVTELMTDVHSLIPQKRPAPRPPVGIEQIHRTCPHDYAGDELSLTFHDSSYVRARSSNWNHGIELIRQVRQARSNLA